MRWFCKVWKYVSLFIRLRLDSDEWWWWISLCAKLDVDNFGNLNFWNWRKFLMQEVSLNFPGLSIKTISLHYNSYNNYLYQNDMLTDKDSFVSQLVYFCITIFIISLFKCIYITCIFFMWQITHEFSFEKIIFIYFFFISRNLKGKLIIFIYQILYSLF